MQSKTLYIECYSGISGDMTVAALLDLGADQVVLEKALESLKLTGYQIKIGRSQKCGIDACDFDVILDDSSQHVHVHPKPISKVRLAGLVPKKISKHTHTHNEGHQHDHKHTHDHHSHSHSGEHAHRNIKDINLLIDKSGITNKAKVLSKKIFGIIALAESKAHGIDIEEVHFHEVGAIDSIVDIVAVAVCIDNLNIEEVIVSELYEGSGHVKCQHGIIPVPVPAVTNVIVEYSLPIRITEARGEMITPTGAAVVAALKTREALPDSYIIKKIGLGAGKKDFDKANILRVSIIEENKDSNSDEIWELQSNIDDSSGENFGFIMEKLMENGANDVFYTPIYMKKNRPAYMLSVLCKESSISTMESLIFKNTTSIGIRKQKMNRTVLKREVIEVESQYGPVRLKVSYYENYKYIYPEYDDVKNICNQTGIGFNTIYNEVKALL